MKNLWAKSFPSSRPQKFHTGKRRSQYKEVNQEFRNFHSKRLLLLFITNFMNLLEKQEFNPVKNVNRQMALARIVDAVLRFERNHNYRASVMQVGAKLFAAAFPGSEHPEAMAHVGIFPRPDICGDWAIVIPKVKEVSDVV